MSSKSTAAPLEPVPQSEPVRWGRVLITLCLVMALTLALVTGSEIPGDSPRIFWGSVMLWMCSFPLVVFASGRGETVPFYSTLGVIYFIYFGLPAFMGNVVVRLVPVTDAQVVEALEFASFGMMFLMVGLYMPIGRRKSWSFKFGAIDPVRPPPAATVALLGALGLFCRAILHLRIVPPTVAQIVLALASAVEAGTGLVFLWVLQGRVVPAPIQLLALLTAVGAMLLELGSGMLAAPVKLAFVYLFVYVAARRRLPWASMGIALVLLMPFLHMKTEFRRRTWEEGRPATDLVDRVTAFVDVTYGALERQEFTTEDLTDALQKRVDAVGLLGVVVAQTPSTVPYWRGETYSTLLWAPIPRFVYPDKPVKMLGQTFGHRYGLMAPNDFSTSLNLPQLVELYANFGQVGMVGMLLIGLLYRGIRQAISGAGVTDVGIVFGIMAMVRVLQIESDFSLVFGGLLWNLALTILIVVVAMRVAQRVRLRKPDDWRRATVDWRGLVRRKRVLR